MPQSGRYESRFLRAIHPSGPRAVWIRQTTHQRPGEPPTVAAWCTLWSGDDGPVAVKESGREPTGRVDARGAVGTAAAHAAVAGRRRSASWELTLAGGEPPLRHLPREWLYRAPLPRTKLESPQPGVLVSGYVDMDGERIELDGWPGTTGHNWGSEHAARWVWLHGIAFPGRPGAWVDIALGRVQLGPVLSPWVANGAIRTEDGRLTIGGLGRRAVVDARPGRLEARLSGPDGLSFTVRATAPLQRTVAFRYSDPTGGGHDVLNCSVAALEVGVARRRAGLEGFTLATEHGGAYELGLPAGGDHGVALQPYPDP